MQFNGSKMKKLIVLFTTFCLFFSNCKTPEATKVFQNDQISVAAERFGDYLPILKNKKVGMIVNQTSVVGRSQTHLVDTLRSLGVSISAIFAPEHGFRGKADAGEKVENTVDEATKIPIVSIYGKKRAPDANDMKNIDVLLFDIQDVGARYYTYISTLQAVMEAAAQFKKPLVLLDRPNPNGHFVDGPVLEKEVKSFVGMQPVPIIYGMTMGEYATMLNTEGWLDGAVRCDLRVVKCRGYDHKTFYELPVKPSPNLPNMAAVYLYASTCFFEGTECSLGRGTEKQFQVYGAPNYDKKASSFSFTPRPNFGSKEPPQNGKLCYGHDLSTLKINDLQQQRRVNLDYLFDAFQHYSPRDSFFLKSKFIDKLAGTRSLREQMLAGKTAAEIRQTWQLGIDNFKRIRKKYLLYADFE